MLIRKESDQKGEIEDIKEWTTHLEFLEIPIKCRDGGRWREGGKERKNKGKESTMDLVTLVTRNLTHVPADVKQRQWEMEGCSDSHNKDWAIDVTTAGDL